MDVGRSITYATQDPDWVRKVLIGGAIMLASWIGSIVIVGIIGYFLLLGYALEIVRRVYYGDDTPLPEWTDIGRYIFSGLALTAGVLLWTLPFVALIVTGITISAVTSPNEGGIAFLGSLCLGLPLLIAVSIFVLPVLAGRYAVKQRFSAMFEPGEVLTEARRVVVPSLVLTAVAFIAGMLAQLGVVACFVGVFVTSWYAYLVIAHLTGQVYRQARHAFAEPHGF